MSGDMRLAFFQIRFLVRFALRLLLSTLLGVFRLLFAPFLFQERPPLQRARLVGDPPVFGDQLLQLIGAPAGEQDLVGADLVVEIVPAEAVPGIDVGPPPADLPLAPPRLEAPREVLVELHALPRFLLAPVLHRQGGRAQRLEGRVTHPVLPRDGPGVLVGKVVAGQDVRPDLIRWLLLGVVLRRRHRDRFLPRRRVQLASGFVLVQFDEIGEEVPAHDPSRKADSGVDEIPFLRQSEIPHHGHRDAEAVVGLDVKIVLDAGELSQDVRKDLKDLQRVALDGVFLAGGLVLLGVASFLHVLEGQLRIDVLVDDDPGVVHQHGVLRLGLLGLGQVDVVEDVKIRIDLDRRQMPRIADDEREEPGIVGVLPGLRFERGDLRLEVVDRFLQARQRHVVGVVFVADGVLQEHVVRIHLGFRGRGIAMLSPQIARTDTASKPLVQHGIDH
mmetsp:Transcript_15747/g.36446  ORF Transcript_15747/g.36446 Transcript_15747/m.36446 type:complete len:445 (-) Transcript_15747:395-1729(-)